MSSESLRFTLSSSSFIFTFSEIVSSTAVSSAPTAISSWSVADAGRMNTRLKIKTINKIMYFLIFIPPLFNNI